LPNYVPASIIMDHLGARTTQKDDLLKVASESTATLAKHPNVYVKLTLVPPIHRVQSAL
jgi:predicted TIM-barrel fold metal-dependent hydrolase